MASMTINMPEIALFEENYLRQLITAFVKSLATTVKTEKQQAPTQTQQIDWRNRPLSPEIMAMTFEERVDLGTTDYEELLVSELEEKYK